MPDTLTSIPASTQPALATPAGAPAAQLTVDVLNDLSNAAALGNLLTSQQGAIFSIAREIAQFSGQPISIAANQRASAGLTLNTDANWTIPATGTAISLTASASGTISISTASKKIAVATRLDSDVTSAVTATTPAGKVYVNIDLAVSIQGQAGASGNINGIGIAGTASDGHTSTLSFCQPVEGTLETSEAIRRAFSEIIFPLDPTNICNMQMGALAHVAFDGTFTAELDVTYGLGDHTFAAPGMATVLASAQKVVSITPPSLEINAGAKASLTYTHTDHFALVVDKSTDTVATIYLLRALQSDLGESVGITAGVTATKVSVAVDQDALKSVVKQVTKSDVLSTAVVNSASTPLNNLETKLNAKLASFAADATGQVGITASLARQKNRTAIFVFDADLTSPALTTASFSALIGGNIQNALQAGGLKLQPGSGVSDSLRRSATLNFQFFNLFSFTSVDTFFSKATADIGPDGSIRLRSDIGEETNNATKSAFSAFRIYFVVTASGTAGSAVTHSDVDLRLEFSEANRSAKGASFAETLSLAPVTPATTEAGRALTNFLKTRPAGKVSLIYDIKSSAYNRLTFNPFTGTKPGPLPHLADENNWSAFHDACFQSGPKLAFVAPFTFADWVTFSRAAVDKVGSTMDPDRHQAGNITNGGNTLANQDTRVSAGFYMEASRCFMNLCENLRILADAAPSATDIAHYNDLLAFITSIITDNVFTDFAVPTAAALVQQLSVGGTRFASHADVPPDNSSITCTLTLS